MKYMKSPKLNIKIGFPVKFWCHLAVETLENDTKCENCDFWRISYIVKLTFFISH